MGVASPSCCGFAAATSHDPEIALDAERARTPRSFRGRSSRGPPVCSSYARPRPPTYTVSAWTPVCASAARRSCASTWSRRIATTSTSIGTFAHPRYEIVATGDVYDGAEEVSRYYEETRAAFRDRRNELIALHHADDRPGRRLRRMEPLPPRGPPGLLLQLLRPPAVQDLRGATRPRRRAPGPHRRYRRP